MKFDFIDRSGKTLVLFDMDGVVAEYHTGEDQAIVDNVPGVYELKRPIRSVIRVAKKLNKDKHITIGILSSCDHPSQVIEKKNWLNRHMPFLEEKNIHIIVWERDGYSLDRRKYGKLERIQSIEGYDHIYLIEDNHINILTTNAVIPNCAHHVSMILE